MGSIQPGNNRLRFEGQQNNHPTQPESDIVKMLRVRDFPIAITRG